MLLGIVLQREISIDSPPGSAAVSQALQYSCPHSQRKCEQVPLWAATSWGLLTEEYIGESVKANGDRGRRTSRNSALSIQTPKQHCPDAVMAVEHHSWSQPPGILGKAGKEIKNSSSLSLGALCGGALAEHSMAEFAPFRLRWERILKCGWKDVMYYTSSSLYCYQVAIQRRALVPGAGQNAA